MHDDERRVEWLATIARNEAFRHRSKAQPEPIATIEDQGGAEDEQVLALVEGADLRGALQQLEDLDRQLLHLRYAEDLTQSAIAELLEMPEGTVKVRLHRARDKLRRAFERQ